MCYGVTKLQTSWSEECSPIIMVESESFLSESIFCDFGRHDRCMVFTEI